MAEKLPFKVVRHPGVRSNLTRRFNRPSRTILQTRSIECPACEGSGKNPSNLEENCPDCNGIGHIKATLESKK